MHLGHYTDLKSSSSTTLLKSMEQLVSHSEMCTLICSFTFLWIILSTYSAVFWKLCQLKWFYSGWWNIPKIYMCVGLHRLLCFIVNLLSFAMLMTCGAHWRHCYSRSFWFSYFSVLVWWLLSICKSLLCILCMLCNLPFFSYWIGIYSHSNKQL